ncbi:MAG: HNH endonuclease [Firmicutes bacterium]|nr:HNH endonuclease [Bacillota bacterium]
MATASEWWNLQFGIGVQDGTDYTGRHIKKASYGQYGSQYGWVLEYIMPLDKGGTKMADNILIVSCVAHILREGRITYSIDGESYQVRKDGSGGYKIFLLENSKLSVWEREFGNAIQVQDFMGRLMQKGAQGKTDSRYAWSVDHILPLAKGGNDTADNKQIVNMLTNCEKADKTTFVSEDGRQYQVRKTSKVDKKYWANGYDYSDKKHCMVEIE